MSRQVAMVSRLGRILSLAVIAGVVFLGSPQPANALLVTFKLIDASGAPGCDDILYESAACGNSSMNVAPYMFADVTDAGGGQVSFKFFWDGDLGSFFTAAPEAEMKQIYWDDSLNLLSNISVGTTTGPDVAFGVGVCGAGGPPPFNCSLPGGNILSPSYDEDLGAKADSGADHGINVIGPAGSAFSETLEILFNGSFAATQIALVNNTLRIGIHAQSLPTSGGGNGESDAYIGEAMLEVPEPATAGSLAVGLAGIAWLRRRKARA